MNEAVEYGFDVRGKRVLVYSLGIEGRDLATWMLAHGATVTMSDTRTDEQLAEAEAVAPDGVERTAAGQPLLPADGFDLVATSQSVLRHEPALAAVAELGVPIVSQAQLFLRLCRGRVVGITGSSGKSTTTALVGEMAKQAGIRHVIGGNIGVPLLERAESIAPDETVIFEISHTQLQFVDRSPAIAAITNVTPNHLDQFSWDEYVDLKRTLLKYQSANSKTVLNADDEVSRTFVADVAGHLFEASTTQRVSRGAWFREGVVFAAGADGERELFKRDQIPLLGGHNVSNVVMACAIGQAMGLPGAALTAACTSFKGIAHRLEVVGTASGALWVNDSIATSPERTTAGLNAFDEPVVLLLGGREKNLPVDSMVAVIGKRCRAVFTFGEAAESFANAASKSTPATQFATLTEAVDAANRTVRRGDVVLMAPAGTSFDAYPNFEARGREFRALVHALPGFLPPGGSS
jgi:UDP-N-acetylmuramoylalanine--D-glutamate ligase